VFSQARRKRAMARFKKIVVISEFMKSRLVVNGLPPERIEVKPPVVKELLSPLGDSEIRRLGEAHELSPSLLNSQTPSSESNQISVEIIDLLYVGQLIRGKGVQLLLKAMSLMKSKRTLDLVGTGNMEHKLKTLAARLGLADRVRFRGFQPNPLDWMRRAACVVVPSFWQEPYGLVAAEAVALNRPVVAFAIGGLPEACGGKATLIPPGDVKALAVALDDSRPSQKELRQ
jgi:glycosyltransferase involved in cell wall biosynthesis